MRIFAPMFRGPLTVLLLRLGALAAIYGLLRILFWRYNAELFPAPPLAAFAGGSRFDASAIAWTNALWVLWVLIRPRPTTWGIRAQFILFMGVNAVALFFNCVDLGYYAFSLKRSTADFLRILATGDDTANLAPAFLRDYWHIALIYLGSLAALAWSYQRIGRIQRDGPAHWSWQVGWRLIAVAGLVVATRGGTQLVPLQPLDASKYGGATYMPVVLNTPFTILTTMGKPTLTEHAYMSDQEAGRRWPVIQHFVPTAPFSFSDRPNKPNVVVIILESFSALYSSELSGGDGYMPFLDSLMREGYNCTNAYANGRRSIDGIPSILASMPQWMDEAFITSPYASLPFTSLANLLGPEGYHSSFYHGGRNGTMGFDGFAKSAGFDRYVGMNEYPGVDADFDGHWGIRDRPFLQFYAHELAREPQPFLSSVFTLSSHHPYQLPDAEATRFAGGTQPIHPTLRYTDDALRQFFATARTMDWFANTLFVITADHTADLERNGAQSDRSIDYWVPLFYYSPRPAAAMDGPPAEIGSFHVLPGRTEQITQHIDILPTVLHVIGYDKPFFSFGHSPFAQRSTRAIWSNNGLYTITGPKLQLVHDGERVLQVRPLDGGGAHQQVIAQELEKDLQAAIQQYSGHLLKGQLRTPAR